MDHPSYEKKLHDPFVLMDCADKIDRAIKKYCPNSSSIAVRGISGAVIGGVISAISGIPLTIIRKGENSHTHLPVQGIDFEGQYVIVDDLISSGNTIDQIVKQIKDELPDVHCAGIFLYEQGYIPACIMKDNTGLYYRGTIPVYIVSGDNFCVNVDISENDKGNIDNSISAAQRIAEDNRAHMLQDLERLIGEFVSVRDNDCIVSFDGILEKAAKEVFWISCEKNTAISASIYFTAENVESVDFKDRFVQLNFTNKGE